MRKGGVIYEIAVRRGETEEEDEEEEEDQREGEDGRRAEMDG